MRIKIKEIEMFYHFITNKTNNELNDVCQGITTDSRLVKKGDIFIALKGKKTNGNLFIDSAINNGAGMVICDRIEYSKDLKNIVKVESSKNYLQEIAFEWREKFDIPFLGITGSNGKTTTKELLYHILSKKYNCMKSKGNINSTVGVPLSLFGLSRKNQLSIIEIGASHPGEIAFITKTIKPQYALITNISMAHIKNYTNISELDTHCK